MKKVAVIVAGGSGQRMGSVVPKQFLQLHDKPILAHTLHAFIQAFEDIELIVVMPASHREAVEKMIQDYFPTFPIRLTTGGETRFHSVQKGLSLIQQEAVIFVHDGVRCLVSPFLIRKCYEVTLEMGSAIPALASRDSVRLYTDKGQLPYDRNKVMLVQTPQTFISSWLLPAYETAFQAEFTDEATVVEKSGKTVTLIEGEETNIKITRPVDLLVAQQLLLFQEKLNDL